MLLIFLKLLFYRISLGSSKLRRPPALPQIIADAKLWCRRWIRIRVKNFPYSTDSRASQCFTSHEAMGQCKALLVLRKPRRFQWGQSDYWIQHRHRKVFRSLSNCQLFPTNTVAEGLGHCCSIDLEQQCSSDSSCYVP
jgi:hypothetical protein